MALDFTGFESIPEHTRGALERYVEHRIPTGSFLYAVLVGDLYTAVERADSVNRQALVALTEFIWRKLPSNIYGNAENIENHLDGRS